MLETVQALWQAGGVALVVLLLLAGGCAALIVREALVLLLRLPIAPGTLPVLGALAAAAPLVGLLGTVIGLVQVFGADVAPEAVAGGIAQALLTTQVGLIVAVPALFARQGLLRWRERRRAQVLLEAIA